MTNTNSVKNDNICAIATAPGGALGIVRVSGPESIHITSSILNNSINKTSPNRVVFRKIINKDTVIDEVLVSIFHHPHSYTGEDSCEISCHGSNYILQQIINLLIEKGCRLAEPGEFTQRAFLNGKMDLCQAEAVADLIASTSQAAHEIAMNQMRGNFSHSLKQLRDQLLHLTTLLELELDFSDHEDLEFADRKELHLLLSEIIDKIKQLTNSFSLGNAIKNGIPVAIIGKTNAGKSTLLNQLVKEERAIVSNVHGTTRDTIEDQMSINGINFRFIDTAGLRETDDEIEKLGIHRSLKEINHAQLILWVIDATESFENLEEVNSILHSENKTTPLIILLNKADKFKDRSSFNNLEEQLRVTLNTQQILNIFQISAKNGIGISEVEDFISTVFQEKLDKAHNTPLISNIRHYNTLKEALTYALTAQTALQNNIGEDLVSEDLRLCIKTLSNIIGDISSQEVLNNVFKNFCVGK